MSPCLDGRSRPNRASSRLAYDPPLKKNKPSLADRGPATPTVLRLRVFLGNLGQAVHPTCRAAPQSPSEDLAAVYPAAPGNRAASPTPTPSWLGSLLLQNTIHMRQNLWVTAGAEWLQAKMAAESQRFKISLVRELRVFSSGK